jgi:hypothetical protein
MRPSPDRIALRYLTRKKAGAFQGRVSVGPAFEIALWYDQPTSMTYLHTLMKSVENVQKDIDKALSGMGYDSLLRWHDPVIQGDSDGLSVRVKTPTSRGFQKLRDDPAASAAVKAVAKRHGFKM